MSTQEPPTRRAPQPFEIPIHLVTKAQHFRDQFLEPLLREPLNEDEQVLWIGQSIMGGGQCLLDPEHLKPEPDSGEVSLNRFYTKESMIQAAVSAAEIVFEFLTIEAEKYACNGEAIGSLRTEYTDWTKLECWDNPVFEISTDDVAVFTFLQYFLDSVRAKIRFEMQETPEEFEHTVALIGRFVRQTKYELPLKSGGSDRSRRRAISSGVRAYATQYFRNTKTLPRGLHKINGISVSFPTSPIFRASRRKSKKQSALASTNSTNAVSSGQIHQANASARKPDWFEVPRGYVVKAKNHWEEKGEPLLREARTDDKFVLWIGWSDAIDDDCLLDPKCLKAVDHTRFYWPDGRGYRDESIAAAAASAAAIAAHLIPSQFAVNGESLGSLAVGFFGGGGLSDGYWVDIVSVRGGMAVFSYIQLALDLMHAHIRLEMEQPPKGLRRYLDVIDKCVKSANYAMPASTGRQAAYAKSAMGDEIRRFVKSYYFDNKSLPTGVCRIKNIDVEFASLRRTKSANSGL